MKPVRLALTGFLLVAAFALSFDALRHQALEARIIGADLFHLGRWNLSAHTLAGVWALVVDALAAVGIVGVREDAKDWKPWVALGLGLGFSFGFQVWDQPWPPLMRAVPPVALAVAVVVFELPRARPIPSAVPQPATVPASERPPPLGPEHPVETRPKAAQGAPRPARPAALGRPTFTPTQLAQIQTWVAEGRTNKSQMFRDLGLTSDRKRKELGRLVDQWQAQPAQVGHPNGDSPGSGS